MPFQVFSLVPAKAPLKTQKLPGIIQGVLKKQK
jgi:hypothetical protein